jgi:thymidylate synthase
VDELDQMVLPPCHYGFQVYTRELSESELWEYIHKNKIEILHQHAVLYGHEVGSELRKSFVPTIKENYNIPTRAISLMWNQRSVDTFLGLPFNIASYGLLLEIIAKEVNMIPDELIGNLGDVHLYNNHIEQAKEQIGREMTTEERNEWHFINRCGGNKRDCKTDWKDFELDQQDVPKRTREPYPLPTLNIFEPAIGKKISILDNLHIWSPNCFIIENYQSHPTIKAPLSN